MWKTAPNHVRRPDGSLLHYTPPERVQDQIEELIRLYGRAEGVHPIVLTAWMHHRFICIHPFADGNGRVGRALSLLVLLRARLAPLVVDRESREQYIRALDAANDGDLEPLIRFFGRLEEVALQSELDPAPPAVKADTAIEVSQGWAERLKVHFDASSAEKKVLVEALAHESVIRSTEYLRNTAEGIVGALSTVDPKARFHIRSAEPPSAESRYWRKQILRSAKDLGFYSNIEDGAWWVKLHVFVLGSLLRYCLVVQRVGRGETGLLAVSVFAERHADDRAADDQTAPESDLPVRLLRLKPSDGLTLLHSDQLDERWDEVSALIERTLSASVDQFARNLG